MQKWRNVAIIALIAAAVAELPGGGRAADLVAAILSIAFAGGIALFLGRQYLERRVDIYSLEERGRGLFYGAIAVAVVTFAAASQLFATVPGSLAFAALCGGCAYALYHTYRVWRQYG